MFRIAKKGSQYLAGKAFVLDKTVIRVLRTHQLRSRSPIWILRSGSGCSDDGRVLLWSSSNRPHVTAPILTREYCRCGL